MGNGDTARFKAAVTTANGGWTMFVSILAVGLTVVALSVAAAYKASATEKQVETNTGDITELKRYGERITVIETTVQHIKEEQEEIKDNQDEIKDNTTDILIELKAMQRQRENDL